MSYKPLRNLFNREPTDGTSRDRIIRCREHPIDEMSVNKARGGLDFVKVKGMITGYRAIEPGLEKRGPIVTKFVRTSLVRFADSRNTRKNGLKRKIKTNCLHSSTWLLRPSLRILNLMKRTHAEFCLLAIVFIRFRQLEKWALDITRKKITDTLCTELRTISGPRTKYVREHGVWHCENQF